MQLTAKILFAAFAGATTLFADTHSSLVAQITAATKLAPVSVEIPQMPPALIQNGITSGEVEAIVEIEPNGQVTDFLVTSSSHVRLAKAVEAAIRNWEFAPAADSADVIHQVFLKLDFTTEGFTVSNADPTQSGTSRFFAYGPSAVKDLDAPLRLKEAASPVTPAAWHATGQKGSAKVSFYIGRDGSVHVPTAIEASDPSLAAAAMDAVKRWRFETPTVDGDPVFVQVQQSFTFAAPESETVGNNVARL